MIMLHNELSIYWGAGVFFSIIVFIWIEIDHPMINNSLSCLYALLINRWVKAKNVYNEVIS